MRIVQELILEVMGDMAKDFAGESLSLDDIKKVLENDSDDVSNALEALVVAKKPLLSKKDNGEYVFIGTDSDIQNLENPDFYEPEIKEKKEISSTHDNSEKEKAINYGLDISENLFSGHPSKGEEGEIPSPYSIVSSQFLGNKKMAAEGMMIEKTGFNHDFLKRVISKMSEDGAINIMPKDSFEDFDETIYKSTSKTKDYLHNVISINEIKSSVVDLNSSENDKINVKSPEESKDNLVESGDPASSAKEFMENNILEMMEYGMQYSKHGLAADLADKFDGKVNDYGSLGKARFASTIEKLAEEGKIISKKQGKSYRYSLPLKSSKSNSLKVEANKSESKSSSSVRDSLGFLGNKSEVSRDDKNISDLVESSLKEDNVDVNNETVPVTSPVVSVDKKEDRVDIDSSLSVIPHEGHPAYNLAILIKASEISGKADVSAISKEFKSLLLKIEGPNSLKDLEIKELNRKLKKWESIAKQFGQI